MGDSPPDEEELVQYPLVAISSTGVKNLALLFTTYIYPTNSVSGTVTEIQRKIWKLGQASECSLYMIQVQRKAGSSWILVEGTRPPLMVDESVENVEDAR